MLSAIVICMVIAAFQIAQADRQFLCSNGECIDDNLKCNGIKNCKDGSDETFRECFNTTCDMKGYFRCSYGGCLLEALQCNGYPDCKDESDENKYLCAGDDKLNELFDELRGDCSSSYAVKCDKKCLMWSQVCNGYPDCTDGFDESVEMCAGSICQENSLRCEYGACIRADQFCNHKHDCADGSDELPYLCARQGELDPNTDTCSQQLIQANIPFAQGFHIMPYSGVANSHIAAQWTQEFEEPRQIMNGVISEWKTHTCPIFFSKGMVVKDYFTGFDFGSSSGIPDRTLIAVSCDEGYVLFGSSINKCMNTEWEHEGFGCMRTCNQKDDIHNSRYTTQCIHDNNLVDCNSKTQISGTKLLVTCRAGYKSLLQTSKPGQHSCTERGTWKTEVANPKCEPICGLKSAHHPNIIPWTVSIFKRSSNQQSVFDFNCFGTIIAPQLIITAETCVSDINNLLDYSIVQGNHSISYNQSEDHGYILHNISKVQSIKFTPSQKLVILKLMNPFSLGAKVRPICLAEENAGLNIESGGVFTHNQLGEAQTRYENNRYVLEHVVISTQTMYNINPFLMSINRAIQKAEN